MDVTGTKWRCKQAERHNGYAPEMEIGSVDGTYVYGWSLRDGKRYRKTRIIRDDKTGGPVGYARMEERTPAEAPPLT